MSENGRERDPKRGFGTVVALVQQACGAPPDGGRVPCGSFTIDSLRGAPPEELSSENLPPFLDWAETVPLQDQFVFSRNAEGRIEFRIDGAVDDPEGDRLDIVWFWVADTGLPTVWYGDLTMTLTPCDLRTLADAERMSVKVLVSDGELTWTGLADTPLPVTVEEGHSVAKRVWEVTLVGECPL